MKKINGKLIVDSQDIFHEEDDAAHLLSQTRLTLEHCMINMPMTSNGYQSSFIIVSFDYLGTSVVFNNIDMIDSIPLRYPYLSFI